MSEGLKIWFCKIGEVSGVDLPTDADLAMRKAVSDAYWQITGRDPGFIFSGWGGGLTEPERAVVENREPSEEHYMQWMEDRRRQLPYPSEVAVCPKCNRPHYNMEDSAACEEIPA
jgi:hypothetical protein